MTEPHSSDPAQPVDAASTPGPTPDGPTPDGDQASLTPMQLAIRQRAQETLESRTRQQHMPRSRWILGAVFMVFMVLVFLLTVDVSVRTMHTILNILLPHPSPPAPVDPKQPYYISVDPDVAGASSNSSASQP